MSQTKPVWEQIKQFNTFAEQLIEKYPERFGKIEPIWFICYAITNKERPDANTKPYEMSGVTEPESFTNTKKYFVKLYLTDWDSRDEAGRKWLVFSALDRLDSDEPDNGKVRGFDYKDQATLVRTLGPDWHQRGNLPDPLLQDIRFVDEPQIDS